MIPAACWCGQQLFVRLQGVLFLLQYCMCFSPTKEGTGMKKGKINFARVVKHQNAREYAADRQLHATLTARPNPQ